jgi:hypothetical protein
MLTRENVLDAVRKGRGTKTLDGRDYARLVDFFPIEEWSVFEVALKEGCTPPEPQPWTEEEVKLQLARDVAFGFEKALDCRGISASLMYNVVKMWMWILEDHELAEETDSDYAQYGLPFLKAVAVKYGFPNPIGEDRGDESKYMEEYE